MFTTTGSNNPNFQDSGRFFPSLHACIITAFHGYQPRHVTIAQVKSIALLETAGNPFYEQICCDFKQNLEEVIKSLGISPAELRQMIHHRTADNKILYPNFKLRHQDVKDAWNESLKEKDKPRLRRLILSCGWGMFRMPGYSIKQYFEGDIFDNWRDCAYSSILQTEMFLRVFDYLMEQSKDDFKLAASMWHAGNEQKTVSTYGQQALKTYNRLISSGHRRD